MTYQEAINRIEAAGQRKKLYPIYLRLERLRWLFATLELDTALPAIHIGGTSGKGSTGSLGAAVLQQAGYRVGLHTTPHLQTPRERMQVNGRLPSEQEFADLTETVWQAAELIEDQNSYGAFNAQEILFTLAVLYFKRQQVDIAVIETFMGGQYDPTNVIQPLLSVITNVELDHTKLLGKTVEAIAMVKAGVIKPRTPFITGANQPGVLDIFSKRCQDLNSACLIIGRENNYRTRLLGLKGTLLSVQVLNNLFANLHLKLLGKHQIDNALLVLYIIQVLRARGWLIPDQAIRAGFSLAFIPGRLEIVQQDPLVILDGAHNPAKTRALAISLRRLFRGKSIIFIFAMKRNKDLERSISPLIPLAAKFILTSFSEKKSRSAAEIKRFIVGKGGSATIRLNPAMALALAQKQVKKDQLICVTGSLYLVGRLRNHWYPHEQEPATSLPIEPAWVIGAGEPIRQQDLPK